MCHIMTKIKSWFKNNIPNNNNFNQNQPMDLSLDIYELVFAEAQKKIRFCIKGR